MSRYLDPKDFFPHYNSNLDYNTNADSFYHYLGKVNHYMKLLTDRIIQMTEENKNTIEDFGDRLDNIKEEMKDFFNQWLADGVLDEIINQDILNSKADKTDLEELRTMILSNVTLIDQNKQDILANESEINRVKHDLSQTKNLLDSTILAIEKRLMNIPLNVKDHGVKGDGKTNDSQALQQANDLATSQRRAIFFPDGEYLFSNIVITTGILTSGRTRFIFDGSPSEKMMTVTQNNLYFDPLFFDGKEKDCTFLNVTGHQNHFTSVSGKNIKLSNGTPSHCFGVIISGDDNYLGYYKGENYQNNGYTNESFPQAILAEGIDNHIGTIKLKNVASALSTTGKPERPTMTYVDVLHIENATDNGIYNLPNSSLEIGQIFYFGMEEPAVFSGIDIFIDTFHVKGKASRIGFENVKKIRINNLHFELDQNGNGAEALFRTRGKNTESGIISIGTISGEIKAQNTGAQLCLLDVGIIKYLLIEKINLVHIYTDQYAVLSRYARLSACEQIKITDVYIKIIDSKNVFTSSDIIQWSLPFLTKQSFFDGLEIEIVRNDGATFSPAVFRGTGFKQEMLRATNMPFQTNIGPYVRELLYAPINSTNGKPAQGYWRKGDFLINSNASENGAYAYLCTETGTPGTWRELS